MNFKLLLFITAILAHHSAGYITDHLPVLPAPQSFSAGTQARKVDHTNFTLRIIDQSGSCGSDCQSILTSGFQRILIGSFTSQLGLPKWRLSIHPEMDAVPPATPTAGLEPLTEVLLALTGNSAQVVVPSVGELQSEDEWYSLEVPIEGTPVIKAKTVFGALHAFETLAQLSEWDDSTAMFTVGRLPLLIDDFPRFKWRGLMIDVARHFYSIKKLEMFVDSIASMKMNVLHLHLSDAQSFAFKIDGVSSFEKAAFGKKAVYSHDDIKGLVEYARYRGVLIVPEVDIPAHTGAWRYFDDDIIANCWSYLTASTGNYMENLLALNPAADKVWDIIKLVLTEVADTFDSPYTHVGGDEVSNTCWQKSTQLAAIQQWMAANNMTSFSEIERYFDLFAQRTAFDTNKRPIIWDDSFTNGNVYSKDVIIHSWHSNDILVNAIKSGHDVIQSYGYYTDRQSPVCSGTCSNIYWMFSWTFHDFYAADPVLGLGLTEEEEKHVLGGEAAQWSESTDAVNVDAMALSRTVAIAERLWSPSTYTDTKAFEPRSQRFRCLSVRRGFSKAGPLYSDYCELNDQ